ncbi:RimK family alpha-L-glutamate ligase [Evansella sp. AB-rgal1]|uniref:ATP-grasp domain-containing protein n=1 Tax=Evansella sp. AB-rgal1 TaxID=3242696 RepID=UPI00359DD034
MNKQQHGLLLYREEDAKRNSRFISFLHEGALNHKMKLTLLTLEELTWKIENGTSPFHFEDGTSPDFLLNRSVSPWLNELAELQGIPVFNSSLVSRIANDKRLAHSYFQKKGVPMLTTLATTKNLLSLNNDILPFPYIVKDPNGRGGTGVFIINSKDDLTTSVPKLSDEIILQPVVENAGKDLRVYIVGNSIVGAVLRSAQSSEEFRANISTGGTSKFHELTQEETTLIKSIMKDIHLDFVGIDFIFGKNNELLFNEMEDAVGCRSLYMNSDINIADVFMKWVKGKVNDEV